MRWHRPAVRVHFGSTEITLMAVTVGRGRLRDGKKGRHMFSITSAAARRNRLRALATAGVAAAVVTVASPALAATSSTTVTPAGDAFQGALSAGSSADFTLGSTAVSCGTSVTNGQVPAAPDNFNGAGAVTSSLSNPSFTDCSTNNFLLTASTETNSTNGSWGIALQYDPAGTTGTLTIPQGGVVVSIGGIASCTVTVAPDGPATVAGTWTPGTADSAPKLGFSNVSVPVKVTGGFFCPTGSTSATFTASYDITDTTSPSSQIAVTS